MTSPSPLILKLVSVILIYTRRKIMIDYVGGGFIEGARNWLDQQNKVNQPR